MTADMEIKDGLLSDVEEYVKGYMANYDPSHDYHHIRRVVALAQRIHAATGSPTSRDVVTLCALLHDVGDRKYLKPGEDGRTLVRDVLLSLGAGRALAGKVQAVCLGVSYTGEVADPEGARRLAAEHPELAIVQDADRLDAVGAVGVGRAFTFGGARGQDMGATMAHFEEKLVRLGDMMKTDVGREMAGVRTERLRLMQEWWADEVGSATGNSPQA
ncbi:hypothetical protein N3K66_004666 [Trichothecium roseum]|uniref:Uncharacterized protein n=1 Tax=Trichothecium roseum TaxID=47278 RepID=A0ACC0V1Y4_9HYPO|nr:hypothetical protein N3K66_004666 [Trichothecium roseum]